MVTQKTASPSSVGTLGRSAVLYAAGIIAVKFLAFLAFPIYTRFLNPEQYGILGVTLTVTNLCAILLPLGLHGSLAHLHHQKGDDIGRARVLGLLLLTCSTSALFVGVTIDLLGPSWAALAFAQVSYQPHLRLAVWTAGFGALLPLALSILQLEHRAGTYALLSGAASGLGLGAGVIVIAGFGGGLLHYQYAQLASTAAILPVILFLLLSRARLCWDGPLLLKALRYSLPLVPHQLLSWILVLSDRLILERFVGLHDLGIYLLAWQMASLISLAGGALNTAWVPHLFEIQNTDRSAPESNRLATYFTAGACVISLTVSLFSPDVVRLLTGPAFHQAAEYIPLLSACMLLGVLYYIPVNKLFVSGKTGWIPVATLVSGACSLLLNLWWIPWMGIQGAVLSSLVSNSALLTVTAYLSKRIPSPPLEHRRLGALLGWTLILLVTAEGPVSKLSPVPAFCIKSAAWLTFPTLLWLILKPDERQAIKIVLSRLPGLKKQKATPP